MGFYYNLTDLRIPVPSAFIELIQASVLLRESSQSPRVDQQKVRNIFGKELQHVGVIDGWPYDRLAKSRCVQALSSAALLEDLEFALETPNLQGLGATLIQFLSDSRNAAIKDYDAKFSEAERGLIKTDGSSFIRQSRESLSLASSVAAGFKTHAVSNSKKEWLHAMAVALLVVAVALALFAVVCIAPLPISVLFGVEALVCALVSVPIFKYQKKMVTIKEWDEAVTKLRDHLLHPDRFHLPMPSHISSHPHYKKFEAEIRSWKNLQDRRLELFNDLEERFSELTSGATPIE